MGDTSQLLRSFFYTIVNELLNASSGDPKVPQNLGRCRNCIRHLSLSCFHPFAKALIHNFLRGEQLGNSQRVEGSGVCWQIKLPIGKYPERYIRMTAYTSFNPHHTRFEVQLNLTFFLRIRDRHEVA